LANSTGIADANASSMKAKILILFLVLAGLLPLVSNAQLTYTTNNGAITITGFTGSPTNIVIPASTNGYPVTNIGNSAFAHCINLTSVTIPGSVISLGSDVFSYCFHLTNIVVDTANAAYSSTNGVLFDKAQTTLIQYPAGLHGSYTVPSSVTTIESAAFQLCTSLASVAIPSSVTSIGNIAFNLCNQLTNIVVDAANPDYSSTNGVLFDKARTTLIQFPGELGGNYIIPNSVTNLGDYAFANCTSLKSVKIPNSVANIDSISFYICTGLTNITFLGNAPTFVILPGITYDFTTWGVSATVYYYYGMSGWGATYGGLPTVMLGAPAPQIGGGGSVGVQFGNFSFTIAGVTNQTVVVEASTNLVDWQPVWTNTLSGASATFADFQWTNYPARFYRAR
jgi:BspA type Leucine rich repeat region (6 copies)